MKRDSNEEQNDLWGDPVLTLTVYNTVQLVFFFLTKTGTGIVWALSLIGAALLFVINALWLTVRTIVQMVGIVLLWVWRFIDAIVSAIAYAIAWVCVGTIGAIAWVMRGLFIGVWRSVALFCYHIPRAVILGVYRALRFCGEKLSDSIHDAALGVATFPERTYEVLQETRNAFVPPRYWERKLFGFIALLLLFTLPFPAIRSYQFLSDVRADTESAALEALGVLQEARTALQEGNTSRAQELFVKAEQSFAHAQSAVARVPSPVRFLAQAIPGHGATLSNGERLLRIGYNGAHIGGRIAQVLAEQSTTQQSQSELFTRITKALDVLDEELPRIQETAELVSHIDQQAVPLRYREQFDSLSGELTHAVALVESLHSSRTLILSALGGTQKRRYLLLFQNNNELRPTGGFIGSYALIDVYRGKLLNVEIPGGGSYDIQGQLTERVSAPEPLHLVNARWEFQDANWFPDFPTSAQKLLWFYEHAGGPTVDGVLAINANFFEQLLSVIGPIGMEGYGKELNADNFMTETQKAVELEYDKKENKPKQFIADLFPKALDALNSGTQNRGDIARVLADALTRRDIQLFLRNPAEQEALTHFGVSGAVREAPLDYQMIVSATVGGGKSDAVITDDVTRETIVRDDGKLEGRITLVRTHAGRRGDLFTGMQNSSYIRFYLPRGTTLLSAQGFRAPSIARFEPTTSDLRDDPFLHMIEGTSAIDPTTGMVVTHEYGKSVFGQWLVLEPGEQATVTLSFLLPFSRSDIPRDKSGTRRYTALFQRQSGSRIHSLTVRIDGQEQRRTPFQNDEVITETLQ